VSKTEFNRRAFLQDGLALTGGLAAAQAAGAKPRGPVLAAPGKAGPLWRHSATQLAELVRTKRVSCSEVMQAHLQRIHDVNPAVNAIGAVLEEQALQAAKTADAAIAQGQRLGPLCGVPVTVKANIDLAGCATSQGVKAWRDNIVNEDAPLVVQLKNAGAIVVGRTNMPDLALRFHTDSSLYGATINPWNKGRTPGGSSGGDAAAVATGMTALGLGNDFGGSLRFPAQCCGVATIRPSRGRIAQAKAQTYGWVLLSEQLFAVQGPMARSAGDLRLALAAIGGADARDPWWVPAPLEGPPLKKPVKVALIVDPAKQGVDPDVAAGVRKAADALAKAGYVIEEPDSGAVAEMADLWAQIVTMEMRVFAMDFLRKNSPAGSVAFWEQMFDLYPALDMHGYMDALARRNVCCRGWSEWGREFPLVLGPVSTAQPFPVGFDIAGKDQAKQMIQSMRLTVTANLLGVPAVALPVGLAKGLPQAVQILGPMYREDLCLEAAETVERALGTYTPIDPKA
jgi:amidase